MFEIGDLEDLWLNEPQGQNIGGGARAYLKAFTQVSVLIVLIVGIFVILFAAVSATIGNGNSNNKFN